MPSSSQRAVECALSAKRDTVHKGNDVHIRKGDGRRNSIVELPSKRVGRFGIEARLILQVMDGQAARKYQNTFISTCGISEVPRVQYDITAETHRSFVIALPSDQLRSGLNDPSIDACTMGTLRKSSPNIRRKGMKTPWSKPGPSKPRPSLPRASSFDVRRARISAYR